jgi:acyl carrier protein
LRGSGLAVLRVLCGFAENDGRITVEDAVRKIVEKCMSMPDLDLEPDTDLWDAGITSVQIVRVMIAVEDEFEIELPEQVLNRATFSTVQSIAQVVREQLPRADSTSEALA